MNNIHKPAVKFDILSRRLEGSRFPMPLLSYHNGLFHSWDTACATAKNRAFGAGFGSDRLPRFARAGEGPWGAYHILCRILKKINGYVYILYLDVVY